MAVLNTIDVEFDDFRLFRVRQDDGTYKWFIDVSYVVITAEGERFRKGKDIELTGTKKTQAKNFLSDIYIQIKNDEV